MEEMVINGKRFREVCEKSEVVLVRTYSAGVHFGVLVSRNGKEGTLENARRLWSWKGACSLNQVAMDGVDLTGSKITMVVPEITLTEIIEVIPMSVAASKAMMEAPSWRR